MQKQTRCREGSSLGRRIKTTALAFTLIGGAQAQVPTISVVDANGTSVNNYRWLIEEDATHHVVPNDSCMEGNLEGCISVDFHRSYMPVVAQGLVISGDQSGLPDLDSSKRYHLSILPTDAGVEGGGSIGSAPIAPGATSVTVNINRLPIPTAQIRVFVFEDNYPINNVPDTPEEQGLEGFQIVLTDAAGRYGIPGGQAMMDAFGNPLGTTYNPDGSVAVMGDGTIFSGPDGIVTIQNLAPGKYGVEVVPPASEGWIQTSTIEGTKTVDAWVKANEPAYFTEFGPPGPHVFIGFVKAFDALATLPGTTRTTISGQVRKIHSSRPPNFSFYTGAPLPGCWVGLNDMSVGIGRGVYATRCNDDSIFTISNVPPGNYQLAIWDENLNAIFGSLNVNIDAAGNCNGTPGCNLLDVPVFAWFAGLESYVFNDENENGFRDPGEMGIPEVPVNLRFRDGTVYQSFPTDNSGAAPFDEVFPFFSWLVAEVDFTRLKATGATIVSDAGGPIDPTNPWSFDGLLNPEPQSENGGLPYRTETGPVLTQGYQAFLGQTNVIQWGKKAYASGENGGISGMAIYATTRAEDDPRYAAAEEWEPGIPRMQIALYEDMDQDGVVDDLNGDGGPTIADVDNWPFDNFPGIEDFDYNGNGLFNAGDAIQITTTDSWDDALPEGCQGEPYVVDPGTTYATQIDCYDGLRNFNQVRPAVFDGGYAFDSYHPGGVTSGSAEVAGLPSGTYIVASGEHPVYEPIKEQDRNVDFGDVYAPAPQLLPPVCVGELHTVPDYMSFQTDASGAPLPGVDPADLIPVPAAGQQRTLCDMKQVNLTDGRNAAVDFFLFTQVPIAGHVVGFILNDLTNEFDPASPTFGEKYSPPFLPVSIRDWTGKEISRTYSDRWGRFNAMVPSTYTANLPMPSGMSPNTLITCMNSPSWDPNHNPQYSQFCYTFQYMPGTTTYLDTPVVPVAAFTGPNQAALECAFPEGTPEVTGVSSPYLLAGESITINGTGFGSAGTVSIGSTELQQISWSDTEIVATVPAGTTTGQLTVTTASGMDSGIGTKVIIGPLQNLVGTGNVNVWNVSAGGGTPIQDAIDQAEPGDIILVEPGVYEELVVLWKPVRLQGYGAGTVVNAIKAPAEKLQAWRDKVSGLISAGEVDLLPGQEVGTGALEPVTLFTEEGPGILVLAKNALAYLGGFGVDRSGLPMAWIDGFTLTGADHAGGIVVNGYANDLEISNNRIFGNHGIYGGGIRIGHPELIADINQGLIYADAQNDNIHIHHNSVIKNASSFAAGGGISLFNGSDYYRVTENLVCGNFTQGDGGGIGHLGRSNGGLIANNIITFNQAFNQGVTVTGGGIFVGGNGPVGGADSGPGSGSVRIEANLIQGNHAGAGDGGGIRLQSVNGQDAANGPRNIWYAIHIVNNLIVNNVSGLAGGGVSLQDAGNVTFLHNTVANNDTTATAGAAFAPGSPNQSTLQPAGIVSHAHSPLLRATAERMNEPLFSSPRMENNIIWRNRSFGFVMDPNQYPPYVGLVPNLDAGEAPSYWDLAVLGIDASLNPMYSLLTDPTGYDPSNRSGDAAFVAGYVNVNPLSILYPEAKTTIAVMPAFDEGGNFIDVHFGPLSIIGSDYHLGIGSAALDMSPDAGVAVDIDGDPRPAGGYDAGADELTPAAAAGLGFGSGGGGGGGGVWLLPLVVAIVLGLRRVRLG